MFTFAVSNALPDESSNYSSPPKQAILSSGKSVRHSFAEGDLLFYTMGVFIDLTGQRFGRLVVSGRANCTNTGNVKWVALCDCGKMTIKSANKLRCGNAVSCGCLWKQNIANRHDAHGLTKHRLYSIWNNMKSRCFNKNNISYCYYGARGILVCDRWMIFMNFYLDMSVSYNEHVSLHGEKNTSLDRINNKMDYCLINCRWATLIEQNNNRSPFNWKRKRTGIRVNGAKLTDADVIKIRAFPKIIADKTIAAEMSVGRQTINNIRNYKTRTNIK